MTPEQFCYWLQGFFEAIGGVPNAGIEPTQALVIRDHLRLVFEKLSPDRHAQAKSNLEHILHSPPGDRRIC